MRAAVVVERHYHVIELGPATLGVLRECLAALARPVARVEVAPERPMPPVRPVGDPLEPLDAEDAITARVWAAVASNFADPGVELACARLSREERARYAKELVLHLGGVVKGKPVERPSGWLVNAANAHWNVSALALEPWSAVVAKASRSPTTWLAPALHDVKEPPKKPSNYPGSPVAEGSDDPARDACQQLGLSRDDYQRAMDEAQERQPRDEGERRRIAAGILEQRAERVGAS